MDLFKELSQWRYEYAIIVGGYKRVEQLKRSSLVDGMTIVSICLLNNFVN